MRSALKNILSVFAVASLVTVLACDSGGSFDPNALANLDEATSSGASPVQFAESSNPMCANAAALPTRTGDLVGWLQSASIAAKDSNGFVEPTAPESATFEAALREVLESGGTASAAAKLAEVGYELSTFADDSGGAFLVVEEKAPQKGRGTVIVNLAPARELWLEAPHADSDAGTLRQSAAHLVSLGARALIVTGSNRCANAKATPCDGKSDVCGGTKRISDAAHYDNSFFMSAHKALRAKYPAAVAVSLHGMQTDANEAAVISDGTDTPGPSSVSVKVRDALNAKLGNAQERAFSCNDPNDQGKYRPLCGTTNVQGRFDNQSPNACGAPATNASGRFVHLEQGSKLRAAQTGPDATAQALSEVVPCSLPGNGLGCAKVEPAC